MPGSPTSRAARLSVASRRHAATQLAQERAAELGAAPYVRSVPAALVRRVSAALRHRWSAPAVQAVALAGILACDVTLLRGVQADLAADAGRGRVVPVAAVPDDAVAPPVRLGIPTLGISTRLIGLRKERSGALQVPDDAARAGWYSQGPAPGDEGPAVLVGHVDSYLGPGIFHRLKTMTKGQRIEVRRADGSLVAFRVQSVETFAKRDFPTERVYRGDGSRSLRLVTCGGGFDRRAKTYLGNVVVFATLDVPGAASATTAAAVG